MATHPSKLGQGAHVSSHPQSWEDPCRRAHAYMDAGAWQRAFDLLWPTLADVWKTREFPAEAFEAVALLLSAATRIGRHALIEVGAAFLESQLGEAVDVGEAGWTARLLLAHAAADRGDYAESRRRLETLESAAPSAPGPAAQLLIRGALLRGRVEILSGQNDQAEVWTLTAIDRARRCESALLLGDGYALLAILARQRGALGESHALCAQAEQVYWRAGHLVGRLQVRLNRAWSLGLMGLLDDADRLFHEVGEGAHHLDRPSTGLRADLGLGWLAMRRGDLDRARHLLLVVWRAARRLKLPREQAVALEYLTEVATLMGRLDHAATALSMSKRFADRAGGAGDLAVELAVREAMLALAHGRPVEARRLARASIRLAGSGKHRWEEAQAWRILGTAYARQKQRREARRSFERARRLYESIGERIEHRLVVAWLDELGGQSTLGASGKQMSEPAVQGDTERFWLEHPLLGPVTENRSQTHRISRRGRVRPAGTGPTRPAAPPAPNAESPGDRALLPEAERGESRMDPIWSELGLRTRTAAMLTALHLAEVYAPGSQPVLVLGETGAGKDLVAQGLHALSGCAGDYVPVNCAAVQRDLFLAELFGARRGAYTGASEERRGLVQAASQGTLFLDEVADLGADAQGYLLRFLDSGEVRPLGADRSHRITARVVTATCRDLPGAVREGHFRRDLYARLAGLVVHLPPLRERAADLDLLVPMLWEQCGGEPSTVQAIFDRTTLGLLKMQAWSGNVRELKQLIERALLFSRKEGQNAAQAHVRGATQARAAVPLSHPVEAGFESSSARGSEHLSDSWPKGAWGHWDPQTLEGALVQAGGNIPEAGKLLGLSRSHAYRLYRRLRRERSA